MLLSSNPFVFFRFGLVHLDTLGSLLIVLNLFLYQRAGVSAIPESSVKKMAYVPGVTSSLAAIDWGSFRTGLPSVSANEAKFPCTHAVRRRGSMRRYLDSVCSGALDVLPTGTVPASMSNSMGDTAS